MTIAGAEGRSAFYKGIAPAMCREATHTALRIGLYEPMKYIVGADNPNSTIAHKFLAGAMSGGVGCLVGNPFDVLKTVMMADERIKIRPVKHYAANIYDRQGILGFYKGLRANFYRACVLTATKMASYDIVKHKLLNLGIHDGLGLQFVSSFLAGFFMACTGAPFGVIRTRLYNQPINIAPIYKGFLDCASKIVQREGAAGLYRGYFAVWGRFAPATTLQLLFFEEIRQLMGMKAL